MAGLLANSMFTFRLASEVFGTVDCWNLFAQRLRSSIAMTVSSLVTVSVINIERYIGVVHPMYHRTKLRKRTLLKFLILFGQYMRDHVCRGYHFITLTFYQRLALSVVWASCCSLRLHTHVSE